MAETCPNDLALCDKAFEACDKSEAKCQEQRKQDQEVITLLMEQRNEAIKDAVNNSGASVLDVITYVVLGVAGGVILTRGLR